MGHSPLHHYLPTYLCSYFLFFHIWAIYFSLSHLLCPLHLTFGPLIFPCIAIWSTHFSLDHNLAHIIGPPLFTCDTTTGPLFPWCHIAGPVHFTLVTTYFGPGNLSISHIFALLVQSSCLVVSISLHSHTCDQHIALSRFRSRHHSCSFLHRSLRSQIPEILRFSHMLWLNLRWVPTFGQFPRGNFRKFCTFHTTKGCSIEINQPPAAAAAKKERKVHKRKKETNVVSVKKIESSFS